MKGTVASHSLRVYVAEAHDVASSDCVDLLYRMYKFCYEIEFSSMFFAFSVLETLNFALVASAQSGVMWRTLVLGLALTCLSRAEYVLETPDPVESVRGLVQRYFAQWPRVVSLACVVLYQTRLAASNSPSLARKAGKTCFKSVNCPETAF
jgi:hypothetical protein